MFTGMVEERGVVRSVTPHRLVVGCQTVAEDSHVDSSVAVNGVCLTVVDNHDGNLSFDVTPETLERSSLGGLGEGGPVNLERPVTLATRLGGHLVQGHVDGVGRIERIEPNEAGAMLVVRADRDIMRYVIEKGSITVDGVSLTIASRDPGMFSVALIPHTLDVTTLGTAKVGDPVNLEADVIAKYVEGFLREEKEQGHE
jgi:riboflavin synthase